MKMTIYFAQLMMMLAPVMIGCSGCSSDESDVEVVADSDSSYAVDDVIIYQVNPKLYVKGTSFAAVDARLQDIADLGTNVLYLMPIYPEGKVNSVGSPYCISNYTEVNADYGTMGELRQLVSDAHGMGMRVIFDWVANHTSWDNEWIDEHKDWYTQDAGGNIISPAGMGWNDVADLNYDNQSMRGAMIDAMIYWINQVGIDGYRCDYADGVPTDFWSKAIGELKALCGDKLIMLAESSDKAMYGCGFDMTYSWTSTAKLQSLYSGKSTVEEFVESSVSELADGKRARFITNHDQASEKCPLDYYNGKDGALSAFVLTTMMGGNPFIYGSQEVGYGKTLSFFNQWQFDWGADREYTEAYCQYMKAFVSTADVRGGQLKTYSTHDVASFYYDCGSHGLLVFVNPTSSEQQIKTPIEHAGMSYTNEVTGENVILSSATTLGAYQYLLLRK